MYRSENETKWHTIYPRIVESMSSTFNVREPIHGLQPGLYLTVLEVVNDYGRSTSKHYTFEGGEHNLYCFFWLFYYYYYFFFIGERFQIVFRYDTFLLFIFFIFLFSLRFSQGGAANRYVFNLRMTVEFFCYILFVSLPNLYVYIAK